MYLRFANPDYLCVSYDSKSKQQFIVCRSLVIDRSLAVVIKQVPSEICLVNRIQLNYFTYVPIYLPTYYYQTPPSNTYLPDVSNINVTLDGLALWTAYF
jgi:hypothetical protein